MARHEVLVKYLLLAYGEEPEVQSWVIYVLVMKIDREVPLALVVFLQDLGKGCTPMGKCRCFFFLILQV
jgi:hypothetical protein